MFLIAFRIVHCNIMEKDNKGKNRNTNQVRKYCQLYVCYHRIYCLFSWNDTNGAQLGYLSDSNKIWF